jgi:hypothetical protein
VDKLQDEFPVRRVATLEGSSTVGVEDAEFGLSKPDEYYEKENYLTIMIITEGYLQFIRLLQELRRFINRHFITFAFIFVRRGRLFFLYIKFMQ